MSAFPIFKYQQPSTNAFFMLFKVLYQVLLLLTIKAGVESRFFLVWHNTKIIYLNYLTILINFRIMSLVLQRALARLSLILQQVQQVLARYVISAAAVIDTVNMFWSGIKRVIHLQTTVYRLFEGTHHCQLNSLRLTC